MLPDFLTYINEQKLFSDKDKILLAVSGGLDSMVLLNLFSTANYCFSVAHCNFQLREKESDGDEMFVKNWCENRGIEYFIERFDTIQMAKNKHISIEMAARELRYEWFEKLRLQHQFDYIATAHHLNDSIETILLNLTKGTGISGLRGILPQNNLIIRPLLFASKGNILEYALVNQLEWREDASNYSDDYQRNLIRNKVIPLLKNINPSLEKTFERTIERMSALERDFFRHVEDFKSEALIEKNDKVYVNIAKLKSTSEYFLEEILKDFGFNFQQSKAIFKSLTSISGKVFYSEKYQLIKDRAYLIISSKMDDKVSLSQNIVLYELPDSMKLTIGELFFEVYKKSERPFALANDSSIAWFDLDKIKFPISVRQWQKGDFFVPLGMKGTKKVSDYLVDKKISRDEKERVFVFCSDNTIAWLMNHRLDDRFKIRENTENILEIRFVQSN